jgi:hypothetical protein
MQLTEEDVVVVEEMVQLPEQVAVVVAWTMEQGCEELDGSDGKVEQLLVAMQLPMLPMNLAEEELVGEQKVQLAEEEVGVAEKIVQLAELVVVAVAGDYYKLQIAQEQQMDLHCDLEVQQVVVEYLASKIWEEAADFLQDLETGDALDYPKHADLAQPVGQKYELFGEYLEEFQA